MNINITENQIWVNEKDCWMCGSLENITYHHTLYKHLDPKKNVIVPLCKECHTRQHSQDISSLYGFAHKIRMTLKDSLNHLIKMINMHKKKEETPTIGDVVKNE